MKLRPYLEEAVRLAKRAHETAKRRGIRLNPTARWLRACEARLAELDEKPALVIVLEGGSVRGLYSTRPVDCYTVDYDTDGADRNAITLLPQDDGHPVEALISHETPFDCPPSPVILAGCIKATRK